jgi:hypothetical protein
MFRHFRARYAYKSMFRQSRSRYAYKSMFRHFRPRYAYKSMFTGPCMHTSLIFRHFRPRYAFKFKVQAFKAQGCIQVQCLGMSGRGMHQVLWSDMSGPGIGGQTRPLFKIFRPDNMHKRHIFRHFRPIYIVRTVYRHRGPLFKCRHFGPMESKAYLQASHAQIKATRPIYRHFSP